MENFPDQLSVREALPEFFRQYDLNNGGYDQKWIMIKLGPVTLPMLPNFPARVKAAKIHDVNHVLTGYAANLRGEAEIGAWEIASGCGHFWAAWLLNLAAVAYGLIFFPRAVFRAFMRGRRARISFYQTLQDPQLLMDRRLGELRREVGTEPEGENTVGDFLLFAAMVGGFVLLGVGLLGGLLLLLRWGGQVL